MLNIQTYNFNKMVLCIYIIYLHTNLHPSFSKLSIMHIGHVHMWENIHLTLRLIKSYNNKATRSPEISREQVQKLTPQFLLYIYIGYRFPLSLSTIWGNHLPVNFMLKFPTCISMIWRNHLPHLTSK